MDTCWEAMADKGKFVPDGKTITRTGWKNA